MAGVGLAVAKLAVEGFPPTVRLAARGQTARVVTAVKASPPFTMLGTVPQQYAATVVVTPQVWRSPALRDAKETVVTVMAAVPLTPSLVALTSADPTPTPVTSPLGSTVAAAGLLLAQVIV